MDSNCEPDFLWVLFFAELEPGVIGGGVGVCNDSSAAEGPATLVDCSPGVDGPSAGIAPSIFGKRGFFDFAGDFPFVGVFAPELGFAGIAFCVAVGPAAGMFEEVERDEDGTKEDALLLEVVLFGVGLPLMLADNE